MKIKFSVLWFDDNSEWLDSMDFEPLCKEIQNWGFEPNIKTVTDPKGFCELSPYNEFDIIVIDKNLEGYDDGQIFISQLRSQQVYTEVIFYTSGSSDELWTEIFSKKLEGVFISTRDMIIEKLIAVGHQSIKKILDLENVRGIVMAEVAEIDKVIDQILLLGTKDIQIESMNTIFENFFNDYKNFHTQKIDMGEEFHKSPSIEKIIDLCDSHNRFKNLMRLMKKSDKIKNYRNDLKNYYQDVLKPRNFLAHGIPESDGKGGYLFSFNGSNYEYNESTSKELRAHLLLYRNKMNEIIKIINN